VNCFTVTTQYSIFIDQQVKEAFCFYSFFPLYIKEKQTKQRFTALYNKAKYKLLAENNLKGVKPLALTL